MTFNEGVKKDVSTDKAFDFRTAKKIGQDILLAGGYDHNYCFDDPHSGIRARSVFLTISQNILHEASNMFFTMNKKES